RDLLPDVGRTEADQVRSQGPGSGCHPHAREHRHDQGAGDVRSRDDGPGSVHRARIRARPRLRPVPSGHHGEPPADRSPVCARRDRQARYARPAGSDVRPGQPPRPGRRDGGPGLGPPSLIPLTPLPPQENYTGAARCMHSHVTNTGDNIVNIPKLLKLLYVQVLIGLILGIALGHFWPEFGAALKPLGDGFVKLVKMMIAPVVFCTIVTGITSLGDSKEIGKTLLKAMGLFYALTILALVTGLVTVFLLQPGAGMHIDPKNLDASVAGRFASQVHIHGFTDFVMHIIPNAFFGAFAEGEVLPVLLLAVLCGFGLTRIGEAAKPVLDGIDGFSHMLFAAFGIIMRLAPIGAFGAMAFTVGRYGIKSIGSLGLLIFTFYIACSFFVAVVLGLLARIHGFKLWQLMLYIKEELLVVLGTSSSEPVLPRLLLKLERLGCKKGVVGLVLPTGYSFNLDGT